MQYFFKLSVVNTVDEIVSHKRNKPMKFVNLLTLLLLPINSVLASSTQEALVAQLLAKSSKQNEEIEQIKVCMKFKSDFKFVGRVTALNNFSNAKSIYTYTAPMKGQYYIAVNGTGTVSPYGAVYIVKNGEPVASSATNAASSILNTSSSVEAELGDILEIRAGRSGGSGYPSFDIAIRLDCVSVL